VSAPLGKNERRARGSLSREEILEGAHAIVAEGGLRALSMPTLAKRLRSGAASIYWYFESKDELLTALTDRVSRDVYRQLPPIGDGPWHEEIFEYFAAFRDLVRSYPVYLEVFTYRVRFLFLHAAMAPSMLRRLEAGLAVFERAGLTPQQAIDAMNACSNYTRGYFVLEHDMSLDRDTHPPALTVADGHPVLGRVGGFDDQLFLDDEQFRLGLRLLIAGIRLQIEERNDRPSGKGRSA